MFNLAQKALFLIIPFISTTAHGYSYTSYTSPTGAWGWTGSYEIMQFTRDTVTLDFDTITTDDDIIISPITLDITEDSDFGAPYYDNGTIRKYSGNGDALIKGIIKVQHGPELGTAYVEVQMRYKIDIDIIQTAQAGQDANGEPYTFYKENRIYQTVLSDTESNETLLIDGFKKVIPEYGVTGVYSACDPTSPDYNTYKDDFADLCYSDVGYGTATFDPELIFSTITSASGEPIGPEVGFYYDEVCLAFPPDKLGVTPTNPDFDQKVDNDDAYLNDNLFRSCEGRSTVLKACIPDPTKTEFNCADLNDDDNPFTIVLADGIAGDRILPAPATTCIGTNVEDWLKLDSDEYKDKDLVITPCDPYQGYMLLPYWFSDSAIKFTNSEGDGRTIDGLQITSITTFGQLDAALYLQESADKTNSTYDFSNVNLNVSYINGLELVDNITGSAGSDVILGGNGDDKLYGFSGDDCIDGQQNDDRLWGDGTASDPSAGPRGADIFVLTSKLGKDVIEDFTPSEGDKIVNTSNATAVASLLDADTNTWIVELKGQNHVIVNVQDGTSLTDANVKNAPLSEFPACKGHPLY